MGSTSSPARRSSARLASLDDARGPYSLIVLSPHFDDAALCLGGAIARETAAGGRPLVVDVFTARPPTSGLSAFARYQHEQWGGGEPWLVREVEEEAAMASLGADHLWLDLPDAIYRGELYASEEALFDEVAEDDPALEPLASSLRDIHRRFPDTPIYAPLGVGGHVDHRLTRQAALELAAGGADVRLYEDVPYCLTPGATESAMSALEAALKLRGIALAPQPLAFGDEHLRAKIAAVGAYGSQARWIFREYGEPAACLRSLAASRARSPDTLAEAAWRLATPGGH